MKRELGVLAPDAGALEPDMSLIVLKEDKGRYFVL